jgi:hypothetical protein
MGKVTIINDNFKWEYDFGEDIITWNEILMNIIHGLNGVGYIIDPVEMEKALYEYPSAERLAKRREADVYDEGSEDEEAWG